MTNEPTQLNIIEYETAGQFTGFLDLENNRIFEHDILEAHFDDIFPENKTIMEILWNEKRGEWGLREIGKV